MPLCIFYLFALFVLSGTPIIFILTLYCLSLNLSYFHLYYSITDFCECPTSSLAQLFQFNLFLIYKAFNLKSCNFSQFLFSSFSNLSILPFITSVAYFLWHLFWIFNYFAHSYIWSFCFFLSCLKFLWWYMSFIVSDDSLVMFAFLMIFIENMIHLLAFFSLSFQYLLALVVY